jgi:hypothetical protein
MSIFSASYVGLEFMHTLVLWDYFHAPPTLPLYDFLQLMICSGERSEYIRTRGLIAAEANSNSDHG